AFMAAHGRLAELGLSGSSTDADIDASLGAAALIAEGKAARALLIAQPTVPTDDPGAKVLWESAKNFFVARGLSISPLPSNADIASFFNAQVAPSIAAAKADRDRVA